MLDEEMDHIIREAAENHHPPYNDKAWDKMEQQLDKHLPQKKDRRRLIFFLLFFLLLGAGTFFVLNNKYGDTKIVASGKNGGGKNQPEKDVKPADYLNKQTDISKEELSASTNAQEHINSPVPVISETKDKTVATGSKPTETDKTRNSKNKYDITNDLTDVNDVVRTNKKKNNGTNKLTPVNEKKKSNYNFADALTNADDVNKGKTELSAGRKQKAGDRSKTKTRISPGELSGEMQGDQAQADKRKPIAGKDNSKLKVHISAPATDNDENNSTALSSTENKDKEIVEAEKKINKEKIKDEPVKKTEPDKKLTAENKNSSSKPDKKKTGNKIGNNFGLTFSVGPDMSFVKLNNTGKTTLTYGAGLSYALTKRFTARAGFYVSKKIYKALPDQYHTAAGNYPYLTDIDANCKVYEIPFSLSYSFGQRKNHSWFGSLGLSSFLMKKEDYIYNYKTPAGQSYTYSNAVSNQNKHYFSVLNLSGGYQYQFNKMLSLQAEPYLQVPLSGVGAGKIKLNSAGVLFTVTLKPFAKKK